MTIVTVAVEGASDEAVVRKILRHVGIECGPVHVTRGKGRLDERLPGYNRAALFSPWVVVRDMDRDAPCAGGLARRLLAHPAGTMRFRIAVRAVEAWLLADTERIGRFLAVATAALPRAPDTIPDPKSKLISLAMQSRKRAIREDMVPVAHGTARVGPAYVARIIEFADGSWRPDVAARRSPSLTRCLAALRSLGESWAPNDGRRPTFSLIGL